MAAIPQIHTKCRSLRNWHLTSVNQGSRQIVAALCVRFGNAVPTTNGSRSDARQKSGRCVKPNCKAKSPKQGAES